jgi:ribulose-phosphate 3-epimerase
MNESFEVFGGIAEKTVEDFQRVVNLLYKNCDGLHVDVADGVFVANKFLDLDEISLPVDMFCEAHLMVVDPREFLEICKEKNFRKVIIHPSSLVQAEGDPCRVIYKRAKELDMLLFWGYEIGAWPEGEQLGCSDGVMFMAVPLGFSGGSFEEGRLEQIAKFKASNPDIVVELDGGVSDKTIGKIRRAGVDWVTSTSWLQSGESVKQNYLDLKSSKYIHPI